MMLRRDVFHAVADPTRRSILDLVAAQISTPTAIAENFNSTRQTISRHIQILIECGLLDQSQCGRNIFYNLNTGKMKEITDWLEPYKKLWQTRLSAMDNLLSEMNQKNRS